MRKLCLLMAFLNLELKNHPKMKNIKLLFLFSLAVFQMKAQENISFPNNAVYGNIGVPIGFLGTINY